MRFPPCLGRVLITRPPARCPVYRNIGRRPEGLRGRRWANGRRHRRPNLTDATPRLAKRAGPAEQETAGSELSGYCERAALARFERDLLGQHDVSNRKGRQRAGNTSRSLDGRFRRPRRHSQPLPHRFCSGCPCRHRLPRNNPSARIAAVGQARGNAAAVAARVLPESPRRRV